MPYAGAVWSTRPVALLVVAAFALGGCSFVGGLRGGRVPSTRGAGAVPSCSTVLPILDTAAAVLGAAVGTVALAQGEPRSANDLRIATDREVGGMFAISGAALAAASAVYGYYENATCDSREVAPAAMAVAMVTVAAPTPTPAPSDRERAWTLTKVASTAAGLADCETVRMLDVQVAQLDLDAHDTVFVRDPAIVRCLMATAAKP